MSRPLRIEYAGALYHVTSRGNARQPIYLDEADFALFLDVLADTCRRFNWVIHSYCLMTNHYHLLVETPDGNLSKGMRQLNGVYTQKFNRKHNRVGHLYQGRYKAILVDKDAYLLEVGRYILLNPVRAHMVDTPDEYPWSSWDCIIGKKEAPDWLAVNQTLLQFGKQKNKAKLRYQQFVLERIGVPLWSNLKQQVYLGSDEFVNKHLPNADLEEGDMKEIPAKQRQAKPLSLKEYEANEDNRNDAIIAAFRSGGYTQKEIGEYYGLHYSRISRIVARGIDS
ncbi:transposase [Vibrio sp. 10N.261.55.A7]|uniref:REP-associated tyrosine transposase n=1 Tax=Vibrio sp. 10N.261.55.A7 TaxID=1880851 RepID=UPI000C86716A|nr:transposase [Vibrio sp. 10N.261.55.A7]PMJ90631.1 addiction module toxin RelE [Vibrio sp. 10N.261.55.A7]